MHCTIVADVVAPVDIGQSGDRIQPHSVDTEPLQVIERLDNAAKVADAVTIGIAPRSRIDLVEYATAPPLWPSVHSVPRLATASYAADICRRSKRDSTNRR